MNIFDFMHEHPVASFLIADVVVTGIVNIVNIIVNGRRNDNV